MSSFEIERQIPAWYSLKFDEPRQQPACKGYECEYSIVALVHTRASDTSIIHYVRTLEMGDH